MVRASGSDKGSKYERDMCKKLSLWWTEGERDDVFWRSQASGGRATIRGRKGAATAGQYGDVAAVDPVGKPLIDAFTIEIKRGYSGATVHDVLDMPDTAAQQQFEKFIAQALESHDRAGSHSWMLITKRDRRLPIVWLPTYALADLRNFGALSDYGRSSIRIEVPPRYFKGGSIHAVGMSLSHFLENTFPYHVHALEQLL
jgi:hypothetical protein